MADYSNIDLQSLLAAPETQSKEPAPGEMPMDMEMPVEESPVAAPEDPAELKLKDVTLMDIVNFILGKYEMSDKLKKALQKVPDEASPISEEAPEEDLMADAETGGEGYGAVPFDAVDQPVPVSGSN